MIIEEITREYLDEQLTCPVWLEIPKGVTVPEQYVLVQKTGAAGRTISIMQGWRSSPMRAGWSMPWTLTRKSRKPWTI